jgi:hypothetical protein
LHVPADSLTRAEAIARLPEQGIVEGLVELDGLLAECEQSQFAGGGDHQLKSLVAKANSSLALINKPRDARLTGGK